MTGLYVSVPVACFRKGMAREFWETEPLPPPSTCYGFLLSMVGETDRRRHIGCRVSASLLGAPDLSVVLRTLWRIKTKSSPPGVGSNKTPGHQQLLSQVELAVWLDSAEEEEKSPTLEQRIIIALDPARRGQIARFGGLSLGESTHLVDEVSPIDPHLGRQGRSFVLDAEGPLTLPVWVDHIGSARTRHAVGQMTPREPISPPAPSTLPRIEPKTQ